MIVVCLICIYLFILLIKRLYFEKIIIDGLERKGVLITGTDTGFGHDFAIKCVEHGMTVFGGCLTSDGANKLNEECKGLKGHMEAIVMDIRSDESVANSRRIVEEVIKKRNIEFYGVVNNAGILGNCLYDALLNVDDYKKCMEVNLFGAIRVAHAFMDLIKKSKGRIVATASVYGRVPLRGLGPYTCSKFAIGAYQDTLRNELKPYGVTTVVVEPGLFKTPITHSDAAYRSMDALWQRASPELRAEYGEEFHAKWKNVVHIILDVLASTHTEFVVNAYWGALVSKFPRRRYHPGWDSKLVYIPMSMMPTRMEDWCLNTIYWLCGAPTPAAAK